MMGKKERARKQADRMTIAARNYAWSYKPYNGTLPTRTDQEMAAYTKGATEWAEKGNALVEVAMQLIEQLRPIKDAVTEDIVFRLKHAIKEYDAP